MLVKGFFLCRLQQCECHALLLSRFGISVSDDRHGLFQHRLLVLAQNKRQMFPHGGTVCFPLSIRRNGQAVFHGGADGKSGGSKGIVLGPHLQKAGTGITARHIPESFLVVAVFVADISVQSRRYLHLSYA